MRLFFLFYAPRSGSTFLARLVSEKLNGVIVLPEIRLPRLLASDGVDVNNLNADRLLKLVDKDHQFHMLGLSPDEIRMCAEKSAVMGAEHFLFTIASCVAEKREIKPDIALFKCGSAAYWWPGLKKSAPSAEFIHIIRDARAVVNSTISAERPYHSGKKMGRGDTWFIALRWKRFVRGLRSLREKGEPIFEIRYEELCENTEKVLDDLACKLGVVVSEEVGVAYKIADQESSIHSNVEKQPLVQRIYAWKNELSKWQGITTEYVAGDELIACGYELWFQKGIGAVAQRYMVFRGVVVHIVLSMRYYLRRIFAYMLSPSYASAQLLRKFRNHKYRSKW